jgi:uncharacterized protein YaiI (UPF0178 family)
MHKPVDRETLAWNNTDGDTYHHKNIRQSLTTRIITEYLR